MLDDLKKYFEETPQDKVEMDWSASTEYDKIGPTVEEFLGVLNASQNK